MSGQLISASDYYPFGMMMPGRIFSLESHRYGFNGMEKDDEMKGTGNSYDFGARILDPRIGRWLSLDPSSEKYPGWNPYNFGLNSPMAIIDPDGKEPNRAQSVTVEQFIGYLKQQKLTTITDIYRHLKDNSTKVPRYIYTEKKGWLDMNHLFSVFENGKIATDMLEPLSGNKAIRDAVFHGNGETSYYSYEDLPSNKVGASMMFLMIIMNDEKLEGEDLYEFLENELNKLEAMHPQDAPNWDQIPAEKDREVLKDENGNVQELSEQELQSGKYVPQNKSSEPYNLEGFPAAPTSNEKSSQE